VPGQQGARSAGCQVSRVPGQQGARSAGWQASRVPGQQGARSAVVPVEQGCQVPGQHIDRSTRTQQLHAGILCLALSSLSSTRQPSTGGWFCRATKTWAQHTKSPDQRLLNSVTCPSLSPPQIISSQMTAQLQTLLLHVSRVPAYFMPNSESHLQCRPGRRRCLAVSVLHPRHGEPAAL
jgi:hypothetical protein